MTVSKFYIDIDSKFAKYHQCSYAAVFMISEPRHLYEFVKLFVFDQSVVSLQEDLSSSNRYFGLSLFGVAISSSLEAMSSERIYDLVENVGNLISPCSCVYNA